MLQSLIEEFSSVLSAADDWVIGMLQLDIRSEKLFLYNTAYRMLAWIYGNLGFMIQCLPA